MTTAVGPQAGGLGRIMAIALRAGALVAVHDAPLGTAMAGESVQRLGIGSVMTENGGLRLAIAVNQTATYCWSGPWEHATAADRAGIFRAS